MPARESARKIIFRAVLWILVFAVSFTAFDRLLLRGLRSWSNAYYASQGAGASLRNKTAFYGEGDGDVLIFGSSRARFAFGAFQMSDRLKVRTITVAAAGRFPRFSRLFYLRHRKENAVKPRAVFYGVDYFMFEKTSMINELAALDRDLKADALNPDGAVNDASSLLSRISLLFRKKPDIDEFFGAVIKLDRAADVSGEDGADSVDVLETEAPLDRAAPRRPYRPQPGAEGADLKKLLSVLEEDGVPVFLVILPDIASTNAINFEQDKYKTDIRALGGLYKNVAVLDFNRPDRFDLSDAALFRTTKSPRSNCHLSEEGRIRFTRNLVDAVLPFFARRGAEEIPPRSWP
ncbi:MAG TPA: hypothetical protein PLX98_10075 [Candidatus Aminicenantes bacterium]|nr:hypothetical protein [Candidatus Aminicenantes bacterium]